MGGSTPVVPIDIGAGPGRIDVAETPHGRERDARLVDLIRGAREALGRAPAQLRDAIVPAIVRECSQGIVGPAREALAVVVLGSAILQAGSECRAVGIAGGKDDHRIPHDRRGRGRGRGVLPPIHRRGFVKVKFSDRREYFDVSTAFYVATRSISTHVTLGDVRSEEIIC